MIDYLVKTLEQIFIKLNSENKPDFSYDKHQQLK